MLNVDGCGRITDRSLAALTANGRCPKLRELNIAGCAAITQAGIRTVRDNRPDIMLVW